MLVKPHTLVASLFLAFLVILPPMLAQQHTTHSKMDEYVEQVSELSSRARANVYFTNPQSPFNGVQVNFVNVGKGNLTFLRRDLVASGRIPLVLARVYDSSGSDSIEFGQGWRLSASEIISVRDDKASLVREDGGLTEFVRSSKNSFVLDKDYPSDYVSLVLINPNTMRATLRTGFTKQYELIGDLFRLTKVMDRNGNEVRLSYEKDQLTRMENANHFIDLTRNDKGRIILAQDDFGRKVQYLYDGKGGLAEVRDLGGQSWTYTYSDEGKLKTAKDPLQRLNFGLFFDEKDRVRRLQLPSGVIQFSYDSAGRVTTVVDRKGLVSRFFQDAEGITTRIVNALGEETAIGLDQARNVISLSRNGAVQEKMEYDNQHRLLVRHSAKDAKTVDFNYSYDASTGLVSSILSNDGPDRSFAYDGKGNITSASLADGVHKYSYSPAGDLTNLVAGNRTLEFSVDRDGLIASVTESKNEVTTMQHGAGGELSSAVLPGGRRMSYTYQPSGLRAKLVSQKGSRSEYSYDPAGNLTGSKIFDDSDKQVNGQKLVMNDSYQLIRWTLFDGTETTYQYDGNGNLTVIKKGDSTTRLEYDALNRLTAVVTPDGVRLEYTYKSGERSLIEQHQHAAFVVEDLRDTGFTFGAAAQVLATRPLAGVLSSVRFSENLGIFQLSNADGSDVARAQENIEAALKKMFIFDSSISASALRSGFNIPFNTMFMPGEYLTINCCPACFYDGSWDCPPCFEPPAPPPSLTAVRPSSAQINEITVPVVLDGVFNDPIVTVNVTGPGILASDGVVFSDADGTHADTIFFFDNTMISGSHNVSVTDSGGTSNTQTFSVSCPTGVDLFTLIPIPLERVYPANKTGVGADAIMLAQPATTNWNGSPIDELLSETSNDCPPVASNACRSSGGFIVGIAGQVPNVFEDFHTNQAIANMLTSGHCSAVCRQVLSACGHVVGTFTIIKTFTADTINGDPVTRVTVDKFPVNQP